jgi:hypothetical protein
MDKTLSKTRLVQFLKNPEAASEAFVDHDWELLIRQARRTNLLSRVAFLVHETNLFSHIPGSLHFHLNGANIIASSNLRSVQWEVSKIYEALSPLNSPVVLLKGAAYVMGGYDAANGRLFSDVDIMVKKAQLNDIEKALVKHGWISTKIDAYDQKYYREWMHELPPMRNLKRQSELDVHHTIIPPTAALKPDIEKIWDDVKPVAEYPGMYVLSPEDMILHSAAHLFHEGDFSHGLRDLVDLDSLIKEQAEKDQNFWPKLTARAIGLDLSRPLFYGLRYCHKLLGTEIPEVDDKKVHDAGAPLPVFRFFMDKMLLKAMAPDYINHPVRFAGIANFLLFVRSHYLRMPLRLLIPHLMKKSLKNE